MQKLHIYEKLFKVSFVSFAGLFISIISPPWDNSSHGGEIIEMNNQQNFQKKLKKNIIRVLIFMTSTTWCHG